MNVPNTYLEFGNRVEVWLQDDIAREAACEHRHHDRDDGILPRHGEVKGEGLLQKLTDKRDTHVKRTGKVAAQAVGVDAASGTRSGGGWDRMQTQTPPP